MKSIFPGVFVATAETPDARLDEKTLRNNFLKVVISYGDLNHEITTEQPAYTVWLIPVHNKYSDNA